MSPFGRILVRCLFCPAVPPTEKAPGTQDDAAWQSGWVGLGRCQPILHMFLHERYPQKLAKIIFLGRFWATSSSILPSGFVFQISHTTFAGCCNPALEIPRPWIDRVLLCSCAKPGCVPRKWFVPLPSFVLRSLDRFATNCFAKSGVEGNFCG